MESVLNVMKKVARVYFNTIANNYRWMYRSGNKII